MTQLRLIRTIGPTLIVLVTSTIYLTFHLSSHNWDPFSFVLIGGKFDPQVNNQSYGYDGQFSYQIAKDPVNGWRYLDVPAYRYQRIFYPMLARALSLGNEVLLPWMLILINWFSLIFATLLLEKILKLNNISRWYALSYGFFAGLWLSLRLDLTEPLAFLFVIVAVFTIQKEKIWLGSLFLILASLTREVTIIFTISFLLSSLFQKNCTNRTKWLIVVLLPFLIWQALLFERFGEFAIRSGGAFATSTEILPYRGWWGFAFKNLSAFFLMSLFVFPTAIVPSFVCLWTSIKELLRRNTTPGSWMLFFNAVLITILPQSILLDPLGLIRTLIGLVVAILVFGIEKQSFRVLNFSLLWLFLFIFVINGGFLPDYPY
ncbi:AZOBR_p60025 family cell surface glycopolymer formation protein [Bellilinea sp.]|uniref:AZOBR_p60025 family cell surface glycopolymer formation protein n=1 Tax=Bellilinea sp. TaxID=2838785 RepID=UPI003A0FEC85